MSTASTRNPTRVSTFASFAIHNYRLFWISALISNIGGWMARIAQDWLILTELTPGSASALGIATALQFLPIPLLTPIAGALADRFDKRKLLIVAQTGLGLVALVLYLLVASGAIQLWHAFALAFATGVCAAFEIPTRQAFVSEMVPLGLLSNAIGLNSAQFNGARLIGPAVAGLLIAAVGVAPALLINAISFLATITALIIMRAAELTPMPKARAERAIRDGFAYVRKSPTITLMLVVIFTMSTFGMNFQLTNALMATEAFGKGATEFGLLGTLMAIGTLGGSVFAARRARPRLRVLLAALCGFAFFNALGAVSPSFGWFGASLVGVGICALTVMTSCNATVQLAADPLYRGRVMAVYMAVNMGGTPIGAPIMGWIGEIWGPRAILTIGSVATFIAFVAVSLYVILHDGIRLHLQASWPPVVIEHPEEAQVTV
ncbi:MFS transporter [Aestuariimicrobium ganziense]|uniref:MFS transporter n=1 Tax=Aestuariimicrobium ganziense TaxID=2773677 RepID=UPI002E2D8DF0|nr:MFS transporter [Aestuariimicrobium ganziense]